MALLSLLQERRTLARARALAAEGRTSEAIALLDASEGASIDALRRQLREAAVERWCTAAERAAERGEGPRARERLERARRYATGELRARVLVTDQRLRAQQVRDTRPEHMVQLVERATQARPDPSWGTMASLALLEAAGAALGRPPLHPDDITDLDETALRSLRPVIAAHYTDEVAAPPPDTPFVSGVLHLAAGRPDRAALPLAESDDRHPLVCFELARTAHLLGLPDVARTALHGFAARAGGHHRVRRLHTGVFLAQMQLAADDPEGAMATLDTVPVLHLGGRPALMYARLLLDHHRAPRALELLEEISAREPDLEGVHTLLDVARAAVVPPTR